MSDHLAVGLPGDVTKTSLIDVSFLISASILSGYIRKVSLSKGSYTTSRSFKKAHEQYIGYVGGHINIFQPLALQSISQPNQ